MRVPGNALIGSLQLGSVIRGLVFCVCSLLLAEGWICAGLLFPLEVSGGSMVPRLLARHYRFSCTCGRVFRVLLPDEIPVPEAVCPQCSCLLPLSRGQFTPGDRVLVLRTGVWNLPLHRWDIICYRDPDNSRNLAVKRLAGLPGEKLCLASGHLYVDGVACPNSEKDLRRLLLPVAHWKGKLGALPVVRGNLGASFPPNGNSGEIPAEGGPWARPLAPDQVSIERRSVPNPECQWQVVELGQVAGLLTDEIVENQWFAIGADLRHQVGSGRVEVEIRWLQGRKEVLVCTQFPPHSYVVWLLPQESRFLVFRASPEDWLESGDRERGHKNSSCIEDPLSREPVFDFEELRIRDSLRAQKDHALPLVNGRHLGEGTLADTHTIQLTMDQVPPLSPSEFFGAWGWCPNEISFVNLCVEPLFKGPWSQRGGIRPAEVMRVASSICWGSEREYSGRKRKTQSSPTSVDPLEPLGNLVPSATGQLWGDLASHTGGDRCRIEWVFLPAEILVKVGRQSICFPIQRISAPNSDRISGGGQAGLEPGGWKKIGRNTKASVRKTWSDAQPDWSRPVVTIAMAEGEDGECISYEVRVERMVYYFDFLSDISLSPSLSAPMQENVFAGTHGGFVPLPAKQMILHCESTRPKNDYDDYITKEDLKSHLRGQSPGDPPVVHPAGNHILAKPGSADLSSYARKWQLGREQYFLLGDNPHISRDSRHFGPIELSPHRNLVGVAVLKVRWSSFRLGPISFQVPWVLPADYIE